MIEYIKPDEPASRQTSWFAPNKAYTLTKAGLSPVNQTTKAFVYCILGAQGNVRSNILGSDGRAKEADNTFDRRRNKAAGCSKVCGALSAGGG